MFYWNFFENKPREEKKENNFEIKTKRQKDTKNVIEELKKMSKKQATEEEKQLLMQLIKEKQEQLIKEEEEEQIKKENPKKLSKEEELKIKIEEDKKRKDEELKQMKANYRDLLRDNTNISPYMSYLNYNNGQQPIQNIVMKKTGN